MDLLRTLKQVGTKAEHAAQCGIGTVKQSWEDVERRLRQRMRIYPSRATQRETQREMKMRAGDKTATPLVTRGDVDLPDMGLPLASHLEEPPLEEAPVEAREETKRKPIISIHGEDVKESDLGEQAA